MRIIVIFLGFSTLLFLLVRWPVRVEPSQPPTTPVDSSELHQVVGKLQYLLSDYPEAISIDGSVLDKHEYEEQQEIVEEIQELLSRGSRLEHVADSTDLFRQFAELQELVTSGQPPDVVQKAASRLREGVIERYQLRMAPEVLPSLAVGRQLFHEACAVCHGSDGRARNDLASQLKPHPTDLQAAHLQNTLSAYQVYNVVTFGLPGTSMPSYQILQKSERWALAFFVMSLRCESSMHVTEDGRRTGAGPSPAVSLTVLAKSTDADLITRMRSQGVAAERMEAVVAHLRCLSAPR